MYLLRTPWNWWIAKLPLKFSLICKTSKDPNGNVSLGSLSVLFTVKAKLHSVFVTLRGLRDTKKRLRGVRWGVGRFSGGRFVLMSEVSPEERLCWKSTLWQGALENWQEMHPWALQAADSVMTVSGAVDWRGLLSLFSQRPEHWNMRGPSLKHLSSLFVLSTNIHT